MPTDFHRSLYHRIPWNNRLIGLKGARGTGKTTLLLQYLKSLDLPNREKVYVSLDDIYFTDASLVDFGKSFYQAGGKILALDEVHKYPSWTREIKNLYDRYADLKIDFTGSSIIEITKHQGDLSRRALMYELQGLSYREYLHFLHHQEYPVIALDDILHPDFEMGDYFSPDFKPLIHFQSYLKTGYYPFAMEGLSEYKMRLRQLSRAVVENDMAEIKGFDIRQAKKILQLLNIIAQQVPFKPNLSSLAQKTSIHRNSLNNYLYFLNEARLIRMLYHKNYSVSTLQKPEKIYLDNTNLVYALSLQEPKSGSIRETFFQNQMSYLHTVRASPQADFVVDNTYTFEIGGRSKTSKQINNLTNAWVVKDDISFPTQRSLPLWIFGFLY